MKLKFVSELIQIASLRFIVALEGSKITERLEEQCKPGFRTVFVSPSMSIVRQPLLLHDSQKKQVSAAAVIVLPRGFGTFANKTT